MGPSQKQTTSLQPTHPYLHAWSYRGHSIPNPQTTHDFFCANHSKLPFVFFDPRRLVIYGNLMIPLILELATFAPETSMRG